jgi:hypothetical protein
VGVGLQELPGDKAGAVSRVGTGTISRERTPKISTCQSGPIGFCYGTLKMRALNLHIHDTAT